MLGLENNEFRTLIELMVTNSDFIEDPERMYEMIEFLDSAETSSVNAVKIFLLKDLDIDTDFIVTLLSKTDKKALSKDKDILEKFKDNDDVLLFLRL